MKILWIWFTNRFMGWEWVVFSPFKTIPEWERLRVYEDPFGKKYVKSFFLNRCYLDDVHVRWRPITGGVVLPKQKTDWDRELKEL